MEDQVGREMVELNAVEVEEASEEGVNGKSQTLKKMGYEDDLLTGARFGNPDRSRAHRQISGALERRDVLLGDS